MNHQAHQTTQLSQQRSSHAGHNHGGHRWMMIACCIPMIAIAIGLVATGVVGVGFIFIALACTAMMAMMHRGMSHGDAGKDERR
ncbi:MAG TPA: hypothetical protein VJ741_00090 [Solirubrobacteraceae bacterium]|nr:hypothetical protein [Solirubrobacteraceae bacterium]